MRAKPRHSSTNESPEHWVSVRNYLVALERERGDQAEVEEIRTDLRVAGWREDSDLVPAGWMFRQRPGLVELY